MSDPSPQGTPVAGDEGRANARRRTLADRAMTLFCVATLAFLVYRDLALAEVRDVEVWLGIEVRGAWARWSAPLHWAIYAGAALAFWRGWPPIWRLAIGYSVYIALSHLIWNLTSDAGGGLAAGVAQGLLFLLPTALLIAMHRRSAAR